MNNVLNICDYCFSRYKLLKLNFFLERWNLGFIALFYSFIWKVSLQILLACTYRIIFACIICIHLSLTFKPHYLPCKAYLLIHYWSKWHVLSDRFDIHHISELNTRSAERNPPPLEISCCAPFKEPCVLCVGNSTYIWYCPKFFAQWLGLIVFPVVLLNIHKLNFIS